jgi:acyl carrier protein
VREKEIREVLAQHGKLAVDAGSISLDTNLYDVGMTSHSTVAVMLGIEDAFGVEFPDRMLNSETFASIKSIEAALETLGA